MTSIVTFRTGCVGTESSVSCDTKETSGVDIDISRGDGGEELGLLFSSVGVLRNMGHLRLEGVVDLGSSLMEEELFLKSERWRGIVDNKDSELSFSALVVRLVICC